jgi:hypothetical protein
MKSINVATELRSGRHHGVFIDDSGSPGQNTEGLDSRRKTWAAVIVPPEHMAEIMDQFPRALSVLQENGVDSQEFHFVDIWNGNGKFKKLDYAQKLGIFRFMVHIFSVYQLKVLIQTFDPNQATDVLDRMACPPNIGLLDLTKTEQIALLFVLIRVRWQLKETGGEGATACVVVDEGLRKSGANMSFPGWAPMFHTGTVVFANSGLCHPLQLADFAAYVLNRTQILRVKEKLGQGDKDFLEIVSPLADNYINIPKAVISDLSNISSLREHLAISQKMTPEE